MRSVLRYANTHGPWDVFLEPRGETERLRLPADWDGDGVIARVVDDRMADELARSHAPVVNVSAISIHTPFPRVTGDVDELARVAVGHFIGRGITDLGYVGLPNRGYSLERQEAIQRESTAQGCTIDVFPTQRGRGQAASRERLKRWLAVLPRRVGVTTWGVTHGIEVIAAAHELGRLVPDDVAVLAGDDDELLCQVSQPPLSGIDVPAEQIGTEAARQLESLMRNPNGVDQRIDIRLPPSGVVERASTEVLAIDDPEVAAAVRFIRDNASRPLQVNDVVEAVAVSRRSLERRFQQQLRHTMGDEIAAMHLQRARRLLEKTDLPIPQVAMASGYGSPEYMATVFKRMMGITPLKYRARAKGC